MREKVIHWIKRLRDFWTALPRKRKTWTISIAAALLAVFIIVMLLLNVKHYTELYSNLTTSEAGQIADTLQSKKIPYKLSGGGTAISVPSNEADSVKIQLAEQGIPKTGEIDYSTFNQNSGFGMTDKQFDVLNRAAMETELETLIASSKGVRSAKVMLTLPSDDTWVTDKDSQKASASIMLDVDPGYQLTDSQVRGLYKLVSKSVSNLPESNIVIMDQYYNYYDEKSNASDGSSTLSAYDQHQQVINSIESNLQRRVTQMLTTIMGQGKVMVNVTANVDFTKTSSDEQLVEPVDQSAMQGLQSSTDRVTETYSGTNASGVAGTGTSDVAGYQSGDSGNGSYNKVEEKVNYVFNKIHREVQDSPYRVTDLGMEVMIEPPKANQASSLSKARISDIRNILATIIRTSIDNGSNQELSARVLSNKIDITVGKFNGNTTMAATPSTNYWPYIAGGAAVLLAAIVLLLLLLRRRRRAQEDAEQAAVLAANMSQNEQNQLEEEKPDQKKYRDLEQLARQKPDEFVKLLRGWMSEDQ
ncbi:MAG: flagellar basal-body MS-ring/collar protein FliF [Sporolactobacillus sp.]